MEQKTSNFTDVMSRSKLGIEVAKLGLAYLANVSKLPESEKYRFQVIISLMTAHQNFIGTHIEEALAEHGAEHHEVLKERLAQVSDNMMISWMLNVSPIAGEKLLTAVMTAVTDPTFMKLIDKRRKQGTHVTMEFSHVLMNADYNEALHMVRLLILELQTELAVLTAPSVLSMMRKAG